MPTVKKEKRERRMRNTHTEMCAYRQPAVKGVGMEETDPVQNELAKESGKGFCSCVEPAAGPEPKGKKTGQKIKALA